ncbi:unnamed protein product, partial [Ectocarpus sp. 4 AP-2014]
MPPPAAARTAAGGEGPGGGSTRTRLGPGGSTRISPTASSLTPLPTPPTCRRHRSSEKNHPETSRPGPRGRPGSPPPTESETSPLPPASGPRTPAAARRGRGSSGEGRRSTRGGAGATPPPPPALVAVLPLGWAGSQRGGRPWPQGAGRGRRPRA